MRELAEQGLAILMISSELPEILGMSDRIAVMRGGHDRRHPRPRRGDAGGDPGAGARRREPAMRRHARHARPAIAASSSVAVAACVLWLVLAVAAPRLLRAATT